VADQEETHGLLRARPSGSQVSAHTEAGGVPCESEALVELDPKEESEKERGKVCSEIPWGHTRKFNTVRGR